MAGSRSACVARPSTINAQLSTSSGSWCNSSISPREGDGPGASPGFLTSLEKENARRTPKEIGLSVRTLLREQSQPRLKDLNAGIWIRAVRRAGTALQNYLRRQPKVIHRCSPLFTAVHRQEFLSAANGCEPTRTRQGENTGSLVSAFQLFQPRVTTSSLVLQGVSPAWDRRVP